MRRVALVTSAKLPKLTTDDRLLLAPLAQRGVQTEPAIWDDAAVDWSSYDAIVLRSTWDYHLKTEMFLHWIKALAATRARLWNPATVICWNANKVYLRDLDAKGIAIVPTIWPDASERATLRERLQELDWKKAVLKPRISATAYRTELITPENANSAQNLFEELLAGPGAMVQRFMDSIIHEGEWSLMFFDGVFSHAILKTPASGDFRAQSDFGGSDRLTDPPPHVLKSATNILQTIEPTLYARVDGVVEDNRFHLMELELIEPALFLSSHPAAPARFAEAIAGKL